MHNFIINKIDSKHELDIASFNDLLDEDSSWDAQQANRFFSDPANGLWIASVDSKPVGFCTAYRLQRFDTKCSEVLLYEIGVAKEHQRKGIASALIREVKNWARENNAREIWVLTNKSNEAAVALYTAEGGKVESDDEQMFVFALD